MDGREAWLLREAARKRATVMGLHEWAEDIAQEAVLRALISPGAPPDAIFFDAALFVVMTSSVMLENTQQYLH